LVLVQKPTFVLLRSNTKATNKAKCICGIS
jgi:hypothetical protein